MLFIALLQTVEPTADYSLEILASAAGVAAVTAAIVAAFRLLSPWEFSGLVTRWLSVGIGVALAALASVAEIGPGAPAGASVAFLILFWGFISLNGATAGFAASGGVDLTRRVRNGAG